MIKHCVLLGLLLPAFAQASEPILPEMVFIIGGKFVMQTGRSTHTLSSFSMSKNTITNAEFIAFLNQVGDKDENGVDFLVEQSLEDAELLKQFNRYAVRPGMEKLPVTGISWRAALAYTRWLSEQTKQEYFLPTEAQWEYAAFANRNADWPWGDKFDATLASCGTDHIQAQAVGSFPPNRFGLHDMVGNVWQWQADCFPHDYQALGKRDPNGFDANCMVPSIRGGSFANPIAQCKPGYRVNYWWRGAPALIGFRVVRSEKETK